jgi:hypothetical protein
VTFWQERSSETKRAPPDPDPDLNTSSEAACLAN